MTFFAILGFIIINVALLAMAFGAIVVLGGITMFDSSVNTKWYCPLIVLSPVAVLILLEWVLWYLAPFTITFSL